MGVKRILCLATWNDTPIAILSDGSVKYHDGDSFIDWKGAHLPKTNNLYSDDVIHKNGWAIIDDLPHFLINPKVDINDTAITVTTNNNWDYPAGVYCLDPEIGLYCRYALNDGTSQQRQVRDVRALFSLSHEKTKFFTSYETWSDAGTNLAIIAAEDASNSIAVTAWLILQPLETIKEITKKLTLIHKKMGTGDEINVYYRKVDDSSVRVAGNWLNSTSFNTTGSTTGITKGWKCFTKVAGAFLSTVESVTGGTTKSIKLSTANPNFVGNEAGVMEFVNFKKLGSVIGGVEFTSLTIPDSEKTRQLWIWIELKQAAGNSLQLDYLITE